MTEEQLKKESGTFPLTPNILKGYMQTQYISNVPAAGEPMQPCDQYETLRFHMHANYEHLC